MYAQFLKKVYASGVVDFDFEGVTPVGIFCVWKKNGQQRLVIDVRRPNCYFAPPDAVHLATSQTFSGINVDEGEQIHPGLTAVRFL